MLTIAQLNEKIAAEAQQFQDYKAAKEGEINGLNLQLTDANNTIAQKDQQIADLQAQLENTGIPDETGTAVDNIVQL